MAKTKLPRVVDTELGRELLCSKCQEYWPMDTEFFHRANTCHGFRTECKACYFELPSVMRKSAKRSALLEQKECA
jgi:hypothetical protein